jgi:hypothetical protein
MTKEDKEHLQRPQPTATQQASMAGVLEPGEPLAGELTPGGSPDGDPATHSLRENAGAFPDWPVLDWLPIVLQVGLPVPSFRVRDLLALESGSIVATKWPNGDDLPLSAGSVQLAWVDMETVEQLMSVRLTRLI